MGSAVNIGFICHLPGLCSPPLRLASQAASYKLPSVGLYPSLRHFLIFAAGCVSVVSHEGRVSVPWNWVLRLSSISFCTKRDADAKSSCGTLTTSNQRMPRTRPSQEVLLALLAACCAILISQSILLDCTRRWSPLKTTSSKAMTLFVKASICS